MANFEKLEKNAWKLKAKDDVKDRIDVIVGDDKQVDFFPQVKIERWDNEVNLSVRLVTDEKKNAKIEDSKVKWEGKDVDIDFFDVEPCEDHPEGAFKFEYILKKKPASNELLFTIETKGLDFFKQAEPRIQREDGSYNCAENIPGSYAVYHNGNPINYVGGKLYKTGKALHIHRPRIIDANGDWAWGDINIGVLNKTYTITIPQGFLDEAVYPIKSNDTFGFLTAGGSNMAFDGGNGPVGGKYPSGGAGDLVSITAWLHGSLWGDFYQYAIYEDGVDGVKVDVTEEPYMEGEDGGEHTLVFPAIPASITSQNYWLYAWTSASGGAPKINYDTTGGDSRSSSGLSYDWTPAPYPATLDDDDFSTNQAYKISIYATYTAGAPPSVYRQQVIII